MTKQGKKNTTPHPNLEEQHIHRKNKKKNCWVNEAGEGGKNLIVQTPKAGAT